MPWDQIAAGVFVGFWIAGSAGAIVGFALWPAPRRTVVSRASFAIGAAGPAAVGGVLTVMMVEAVKLAMLLPSSQKGGPNWRVVPIVIVMTEIFLVFIAGSFVGYAAHRLRPFRMSWAARVVIATGCAIVGALLALRGISGPMAWRLATPPVHIGPGAAQWALLGFVWSVAVSELQALNRPTAVRQLTCPP